MSEFDDIQERLVGAVEEVADHLNRHSSEPCTATEIANIILAREINWLTLSVNRQAMALDKIADELEKLMPALFSEQPKQGDTDENGF